MYAQIKHNPRGGYVALITAILISVSLLIMVVAVSFQGFFSRFTVLESQQKEQSIFLAEACVETARLEIAQDTSYSGGETIHVGTGECRIVSVSGPAGAKVVQATATSSDAFTNLEVEVDASSLPDVTITSWEEVPSF